MGEAAPAQDEGLRPVDEAICAWRKVSDSALKACAEKLTPAARIIGILILSLAVGCAGLNEAPPDLTAQSGPPIVDPSPDPVFASESPLPEALQEAVALAPPPAAPRQPVMIGGETGANEPLAGASVPPSKSQSTAKSVQPPARAPAAVSVSAAPQPRKNEALVPIATKLEPPLDVAALKTRLRDTNAIGVFTKLALKKQVDDLLQQFRTHYLNGQKTGNAALRQSYDMLVLKVLALIQDNDPSLARTIAGSREAIWGILADPEQFNSTS